MSELYGGTGSIRDEAGGDEVCMGCPDEVLEVQEKAQRAWI